MAEIIYQDPESTEVQSPLIAGLSEGLHNLSSALNMKTATFKDVQLTPLAIDNKQENKNRIYQIAFGKKLWLKIPAIIVKVNGLEIKQETRPFSIDYIGGSITFATPLRDEDSVSVSATYITADSVTVTTLANLVSQVEKKSDRYKGYFETEQELSTQFSEGKDGDIAFVATPQFAVFAWDSKKTAWRNTQSIEDLKEYITREEVNAALDTKEPNIAPKGDALGDDRFFYGGRKSWQDFDATARAVPLTGLQTGSKEPVAPTDTILQAMGKLAGSAQEVREKGYLEGTGEPTTGTVGKVGQRYVNTSTGKWYTCVGVQDGTYTWKEGLNAEPGKGLSTNDFTTPEKEKLATLGERKELLFTATAEGWSAEKPFTQTIQVEGSVEKCDPFFDLQPASKTKETKKEFGKVDSLETKDGSIILTAKEEKPGVNLDIRVWVK